MQLIALARFEYAHKQLRPGDSFEAPDLHAALLKNGKKAKDAPPPRPKAEVATLALDATDGDVATPKARSKRQYNRRDLVAEEEPAK